MLGSSLTLRALFSAVVVFEQFAHLHLSVQWMQEMFPKARLICLFFLSVCLFCLNFCSILCCHRRPSLFWLQRRYGRCEKPVLTSPTLCSPFQLTSRFKTFILCPPYSPSGDLLSFPWTWPADQTFSCLFSKEFLEGRMNKQSANSVDFQSCQLNPKL